ncbi:MAG: methylmalonyl Co-A mutase-associated GTPase MeaB, partial [Anaerolineales bacterium]|nr:methylmalonyl Co-A mutase-associated GTPase MeaB [Anaerolineales bacterium]MCB8959650.1 methylmalonyl Co-A mutase-associated GTPase MeaB [Ardenticatenales bacterium]
MDELIEGVRRGRRRAIARILTRVENDELAAREIIQQLHGGTGRSHIIGLTGPPGSGKSTLTTQIAGELRRRDKTVGIIAVDPSSPFSGGALLGDRIRMRDLSGDSGVFIRSLASRGQLGGLSAATRGMARVLDAAGFDAILIETVGAGQAEVDIAALAHTTLVIEAPGMGDDIQTSKAGILEIADLLVVNKADRPTARQTVQALQMMLDLGHRHNDNRAGASWQVPVLSTVATTGEGVPALVDRIEAHFDYLQRSGRLQEREQERAARELEQLARQMLWRRILAEVPAATRETLTAAVANREMDPYSAAAELVAAVLPQRSDFAGDDT